MSTPPPPHPNALQAAIITENFLPKIDGVTITLTHLLEHLNALGVRSMLFGPESGTAEYAGCQLFGTYGVPLRVYPGLKINFLSTAFLHALRQLRPDIIHLVDPIWLGVQSLAAIQVLLAQHVYLFIPSLSAWRGWAQHRLARGSRLLRILQSAVDLAVVVHSIVLATLSHASYMVPNTADLFGP
ncbi:hypothetical protein C8J57DRAFT_1658779 [Mycena rebaudengoi]|nr:hypothetical protein C8J57DRAFT_1658779 [Mycena rebaudengoi]